MDVRRARVVGFADQQVDEPDDGGLVGEVAGVGEPIFDAICGGAELGVQVLDQLKH